MTMFRVLELFSGMGGMHCALDFLEVNYEIVAAIDVNPTANLVYALNFPQVPICSRAIETIPLKQWEKWAADVWLMSPPCQPFTRQGKQEDLNDRRTNAFVYLMKTIIPQISCKPKYLLLENVAGFEHSQAHQLLLSTLEENNYSSRQYLLSPLQFGIPNSRLRYYLIADRCERMTHPIEIRLSNFQFCFQKLRQRFPLKRTTNDETSRSSTVVAHRLCNDQITDKCSHASEILIDPTDSLIINDFLVSDENPAFELDEKQSQRSLHITDIISGQSRRSLCFTKAYGKYFEGTGSLLSTSSGRVRYFTPTEIANLHCFPSTYQFPDQLSIRQQYAVLGNGLNIFVVAALLENLFKRS